MDFINAQSCYRNKRLIKNLCKFNCSLWKIPYLNLLYGNARDEDGTDQNRESYLKMNNVSYELLTTISEVTDELNN